MVIYRRQGLGTDRHGARHTMKGMKDPNTVDRSGRHDVHVPYEEHVSKSVLKEYSLSGQLSSSDARLGRLWDSEPTESAARLAGQGNGPRAHRPAGRFRGNHHSSETGSGRDSPRALSADGHDGQIMGGLIMGVSVAPSRSTAHVSGGWSSSTWPARIRSSEYAGGPSSERSKRCPSLPSPAAAVHPMTIGFTGEPVAPVTFSGATVMNPSKQRSRPICARLRCSIR